ATRRIPERKIARHNQAGAPVCFPNPAQTPASTGSLLDRVRRSRRGGRGVLPGEGLPESFAAFDLSLLIAYRLTSFVSASLKKGIFEWVWPRFVQSKVPGGREFCSLTKLPGK